ncbi:Small heat shock protein C4 [Cardinium endosymbiont cEper1 of Encarsia pergandiella]|uniref:Hsp20/alpha crystallin family protein n=1 Tax=Cardinium endosymbiont of Encarsia pergandiella TaxID=249402 RepID=UPI00027E9D18|nr:Hsp20/alpha crystallin family protein [Cardinium endosymbiont of Encarsia pergandiella]CCM10623.1 Small heat shock protein C4 [Cardinium endosymbiont cEper1 of Encarsia pergandiella]
MVRNNLPSFRYKNQPSISEIGREGDIIERVFNDFYSLLPDFPSKIKNIVPRIDVSESNSNYYIEAELPGIELKDVDVQVNGNVLSIRAKKESNTEQKEKSYYIQERYTGSLHRSISLPNSADIDNISAKLQDGILRLTIPKKERAVTKNIEISNE